MLHFVPTPIGNLEDISLRSLKIISEATTIFCEDTRVAKRLIYLLEQKNQISFKQKNYISMHSHNEQKVLESLDLNLFEEDLAYLSDAGMPCVSDPGCELVKYLQKNSIDYEVLPGSNAALLAYAASGFCSKEFLFCGFLPHKEKARSGELQRLLYSGFVTIFYESPHRISKLIEELASIVPLREVFVIKEASKLHELKLKKRASDLVKEFKNINQKGEWVVVVDSSQTIGGVITVEDVLSLNIPKKDASKLISKITGESSKECYEKLIKSETQNKV